jgi:CRISP-associated protein Cas1
MGWRIITVSSRSKLELKMNYLVIRNDVIKRIHLDEISVLVIENTGCSLTASLLEALWKKRINIIFCDAKRNPSAQLLPFTARFESNSQLFSQLSWDEEMKKLVWSEIINQKITKQSENLRRVNPVLADKLLEYTKEIEPGDITNREGHAAKVYFNAIFYPEFSRDDICPENIALNYGYSVILSCINRIIVSCGYSTQLGIFHHNTYNQFNLGCDLMEPFRPLVDFKVSQLKLENELSTENKHKLLDILNEGVYIGEQKTTLLNAMQIYVRGIFSAIEEKDMSFLKAYNYEF